MRDMICFKIRFNAIKTLRVANCCGERKCFKSMTPLIQQPQQLAARGGRFLVRMMFAIFSSQQRARLLRILQMQVNSLHERALHLPPVTAPAPPNRGLWVLKHSIHESKRLPFKSSNAFPRLQLIPS